MCPSMADARNTNSDVRLERLLEGITNPEHQDQARKYLARRMARGARPATLWNHAHAIRDFSAHLGTKPFLEATEDDFVDYVNRRGRQRLYRNFRKDGTAHETLRTVKLSDRTMDARRDCLRVFYGYLGGGNVPQTFKVIASKIARREGVITDRLVSRPELVKLMQACGQDLRLKALVAVLWETGLRAGEITALSIRHVEFDAGGRGAILRLPMKRAGLKTGARNVRILPNESEPHLRNWLEAHPDKTNPDAPLFFGISKRNRQGRLDSSALWGIISRLGRTAKLDAALTTHDFRHTAATTKASLGYTEAELRHYFGWTRNSDMPTHYVHLAAGDFDRRMFEIHGLKPTENRERAVMFAPCPVCEHTNDTTNLYCGRCRTALKPQADDDAVENKNEELMDLVRDLVREQIAALAKSAPAR